MGDEELDVLPANALRKLRMEKGISQSRLARRLVGESSGGGSVSLLPLVPGSHAYINRVIADSGSPCLTRTTEQAIQCTKDLMEELGCKTVADLKNASIQQLLVADYTRNLARVTPEKDGK